MRVLRGALALLAIGLSSVTLPSAVAADAPTPGSNRTAALQRHPNRRPATLASNTAAAKADAARLLSEVALPAGARRVNAEPAGDHGYLKPLPHLVATTIGFVDTRWWKVTGATPARVIDAVRTRPPGGASVSGTTVAGNLGTGTSATGLVLSLPDVPGVLGNRMVEVTATALSGGGTGVLAQSQSVWILPRSAGSIVPSATRLITLTETAASGGVLRAATVSSATRVRAAIRYFNGLEAGQPGTSSCPAALAQPDVLTVRFLSRQGAAPLATARFSGDFGPPGSGVSSQCDEVQLRVGTTPPVGLLGGDYVVALNRLLGTHIP